MYQQRFVALSDYMSGYILTTSSRREQFRIKNFTYSSIARKNKLPLFSFILFCLNKTLYIIKNKDRINCIITYDPIVTGMIGCILKKIFNTKLIVEVNGVYTSNITWQDGGTSFSSRIKKKFTPIIMRFVFGIADGIYLLFPSQIDQFKRESKKKTLACFPCWVPTGFFTNKGENKEILLIGFPFKIKGVDILIKAFKKISPEYPEWKLKILGWYPDMQELKTAMGSHPRIYHHPPVLYTEIPEHIGRCGIFVLPSRTEAMGRVLVEAAAAGKPRIGSNIHGIPTVINDGIDGFLVEPENPDDLAGKLELLMNDPDLRKKIGRAAQIRAENDFKEDRYIQNTVQFYKNVLQTI